MSPATSRNHRRRSSDYPRVRRLGLSAILAAGVVLATATPAFAHALDGAEATNYRTRITSISPRVPGVEVRVVEAGNRLELTNHTDADVVVPGYSQFREPYLRVGPDGVFENVRSPATYLNVARIPTEDPPPIADAEAPPEWRRVSDGRTARWHDHRAHFMGSEPPPAVRLAPGREHLIQEVWEVPLRVGDETIVVRGDLTWVPGPSPAPWLALATVAGLAVAGAVFATRPRPALGRRFVLGTLLGLVVLDAAHLAGLAIETAAPVGRALGSNPQALATWAVSGLAAWRLLAGDERFGPALVAAAGALFSLSAATDFAVLSSSQVPTAGPEWVPRLAVAVLLGAGVGLIATAFAALSARQEAAAQEAAAVEAAAAESAPER